MDFLAWIFLLANPETVAKCRRNLSNISVFMQYLNQDIARRANLEDGTTGHFFGDRFGCRSLLDERAILICALYIDLNELRAQLALAPEDAEFSSAYLRILRKLRRQIRDAELAAGIPESKVIAEDDPGEWLCPIDEQECLPLLGPPGAESVEISRRQLEGKGEPGANSKPFNPGDVRKTWRHGILGMHLDDYLKFLDWHARRIVSGKAGVMDPSLPPIMERLGITADQLIQAVDNFDTWFHGAVGSPESLTDEAARRGRRWLQGIGPSRLVFS